jgi:hypothetical protein
MAAFADTSVAPPERFEGFARAAAEQLPSLATPPDELESPDPNRDAVLSLGALLAFAAAPHDVPAIRHDAWYLLEQTLGVEQTFRWTPVEQYRVHLEFAEEMDCHLRAAGIPVRDVLDTQSLIQLGGGELDFWAARRNGGGAPPAYLSVCAIYRDEGDYLAEWVEFHRAVGVERFFLYNNFSADHHREVLAPYVEQGIVEVRDWPVLDGRVGQIAAYDDCLRWHRYDSKWIAFLDLDEFLFSPGERPLASVLAGYEDWPAVAVRWVMFGTSGHETRVRGLVTENFRRRIEFDGDINMKTIADPVRTMRCASAHSFTYPYLMAVDENGVPVRGTRAPTDSADHVRINHYHWKSREEYIAKCARMRHIGRPREVPDEEHFRWLAAAEAAGCDDEAIQRFVPAVREALGLSAPETAPRTS